MAWLSGWDKRIKLDIADYAGDIGASVTWFPVTVFLTATQGEEVFVELTTDAEYLKVAFTKADGTTELYAEKELFDVSEELGIFHVSRDGWTINANTSIYMYYDADHADNNTYIGAINTTPGAAVWDGNFVAVFHMVDATTSTVVDSTSNNIDLTKASANNPLQTTSGKVGYAQDFSSDYITHITFLDVMPDNITVEAIVKLDTIDIYHFVFAKQNKSSADQIILQITNGNKFRFIAEAEEVGSENVDSVASLSTATWYYLAGVHTAGAAIKNYLDTTEATGGVVATILDGTDEDAYIGALNATPDLPLDGIIDEIRVSSAARAAAWLKGTYNSLWDSLLTYGSEETEAISISTLVIGGNF